MGRIDKTGKMWGLRSWADGASPHIIILKMVKQETFNLSDEIEIFNPKEDGFILMDESCVKEKYVKEFIKRLKKEASFFCGLNDTGTEECRRLHHIIDKLAGEKFAE